VTMIMIGEVQLPASRRAVWAMLNEPAVLKSCIPGWESLDKDSDSEFRAVATRATYIPLALTLVLCVPHGA
jgi:carbon monoxide dehydrogenase subunit G